MCRGVPLLFRLSIPIPVDCTVDVNHLCFVFQVQVGEQTCTGVGPNKKLAKRNAAEAMLQLLGYSRPSPQPSKPAIKSGVDGGPILTGDKKVTFIDQNVNPTRQLVPGVLLMPEGNRGGFMGQGNNTGRGSHYPTSMGNFSLQTTVTIAKELVDTGDYQSTSLILACQHHKYSVSIKGLTTGFCSTVPDLYGTAEMVWSKTLLLLLFHNK